jgi:hypothetical protein
MTRAEFQTLPWLLFEHQVRDVTGYAAGTVAKLFDCGVLKPIKPEGCHQAKVRKVQVAQMLKLESWLDRQAWEAQPALMGAKAVSAWTGYSLATLRKMVTAGSLELIRPSCFNRGRFRKAQVGRLIGLETDNNNKTER